jgi:hypothetical protein
MEQESKTRHTEGPWQRSGVRIKLGSEDCLQVGPDGFAIAFLPIGKRPMEQAGAIADANLIAAAPDLLEALREMLIQFGVRGGNGASAQARAAIARATGAQS